MRPILLSGHERSLTQVKYSPDGDLIFSVSKDLAVCAWYSANGERLGTYHGHQGALWTVDVDPTTTLLATGGADNTIRLWEVKSGRMLKTWDFGSSVKRVEFAPVESGVGGDGNGPLRLSLLGVTERRSNQPSTVVVYEIVIDVEAEQSDEQSLKILCEDSKATVAGFSYGGEWIIVGHEDGSVSRFDGKTGELQDNVQVHEFDQPITDLQWAPDRTYFITASKDKSARLVSATDLVVLKTYQTDTPLNSAAITPKKDYVILGGGQAAMDVTTTSARQGKFEARFFHKIFEEEIGRVRGHFGPLNYVAVHPEGTGYCSGGEDGYVRVHHFDKAYFDFLYEVEREQPRL